MIRSLLEGFVAHWKAGALISCVFAWIGLIANQVTAPKVMGVMVAIQEWDRVTTGRLILGALFSVAVGVVVSLHNKRRLKKTLEARSRVQEQKDAALRREIDVELLKAVKDIRKEGRK